MARPRNALDNIRSAIRVTLLAFLTWSASYLACMRNLLRLDFAIMAGVTWASRDFLHMLRDFVFMRTNCRSIANLQRLVCAFPP